MKLDVKETIAKAEQDGSIFLIKGVWKGLFIFAGLLSCLLVLTIPLGIWIIMAAKKSRIGLTDEGFAFQGLGSSAWRWEDVEEFKASGSASMNAGGGLLGAMAGAALSAAVAAKTEGLKGPLQFRIKGQRGWKAMPTHTIQNTGEMAAEMERRTGLPIFARAATEA
ncbi:MAG: hypothetical protein ACJAYU_002128 [Bradymonadia bacterium]|jgi:hypothetical protein